MNEITGCWGTGLYSNDTAADLRPVIGAIVKLPLDEDKLVETIKGAFPQAANDPDDEDYATFWLVLADQFHKKGIASPQVFDQALEIIDNGSDLRMAAELGMDASELRRQGGMLQALREKISKPVVVKSRKTLKKPQPLIMEIGDVLFYPVAEDWAEHKGHSIYEGGFSLSPRNPYFTETELEEDGWTQVDWGAVVIVDCGRAFGYLSWYRPLIACSPLRVKVKPNYESIMRPRRWRFGLAGTCSKSHFERMKLEMAGNVEIDRRKFENLPGVLLAGVGAATSDRSISNCLGITDSDESHVERLADIIVS